MLPLEVLEEAQRELLDFAGTGMSVCEISHRDKAFSAIVEEAEANLRELMNIPEDYCVLFVQGGASQQFAAVPLNLMHTGKADYIVTGNFSKKAWQEGQIYGEAVKIGDSSDKTYTYIPDVDALPYSEGADYVHITSNNTIFGTRYAKFPECKAPLVADMSSEIFSRKVDVSKFGVIYAGAQKNLAPAGVTIVIAKRSLIQEPLKICPTMLKWKVQDENGSLYNTPPCFSIYMADLVLRHFGIADRFAFVGGRDDATRRTKEEVIRYVMQCNGLTDPSQIVMIGDRKHDILGARAVGLDSVGVLYGYGSRQEFEAAGATYIVNDLDELQRLLL